MATVNLENSRHGDSVCASNCASCNNRVIQEIKKFNLDRNAKSLEGIDCACRVEYNKHLSLEEQEFGKLSLPERVQNFLTKYHGESI